MTISDLANGMAKTYNIRVILHRRLIIYYLEKKKKAVQTAKNTSRTPWHDWTTAVRDVGISRPRFSVGDMACRCPHAFLNKKDALSNDAETMLHSLFLPIAVLPLFCHTCVTKFMKDQIHISVIYTA